MKFADLITERGRMLNPDYSIFRDQPIAGASPLRINVLLSRDCRTGEPWEGVVPRLGRYQFPFLSTQVMQARYQTAAKSSPPATAATGYQSAAINPPTPTMIDSHKNAFATPRDPIPHNPSVTHQGRGVSADVSLGD